MTGNHIIVKDLKGIKNLDFEIPSPGVHVLTASNGSGKTTLMVCMSRLSDTRAFNKYFVQHRSWNVDSFDNSKITYKSRRGNKVEYTYRKASDSWRALTRSTQAMGEFGYSNIIIIPTLGKRVYVQDQTIAGGKVRAASHQLREAMSNVLENDKFRKLLKTNLGETRGRGGRNRRNNTAYLLSSGVVRKKGRRVKTYYSESSFSLGEIFTLNLLFELQTVQNKSLIVIDELEVALHPKVQINLLSYLQGVAREKELTVIISTHSSSIIKCAPNLIYLNNISGVVNVHYNCYPALALQEVAVEEDGQPDYIFFVEDSAAELLLKEIIKVYFQINPAKQQPLWKVLPIGGYTEVLRFIKRADQYLLHRRIGQYCFLDKDVEDVKSTLQSKGSRRTPAENTLWDLFASQEDKIRYLDITPELGLWNWMSENMDSATTLVNIRFPDSSIDIRRLLQRCNQNFPSVAQNPREGAKNKVNWMLNDLVASTNEDSKRIKQNLFSAFVESHYQTQGEKNKLNGLFGRIFNRRGN